MSKEKFETVLDYGSSKLRIGIIDKNFPKNKFFLDQKIIDDSNIDEFNFENYQTNNKFRHRFRIDFH